MGCGTVRRFWRPLLPVQILSQPLRPVLREHVVQVLFLQPAFVSNAEQRIEPPDGRTIRRRRDLTERGRWTTVYKWMIITYTCRSATTKIKRTCIHEHLSDILMWAKWSTVLQTAMTVLSERTRTCASFTLDLTNQTKWFNRKLPA